MTQQNTSPAVMAQRKEQLDSLDYYPTPPWATRALIEYILKPHADAYDFKVAIEPACGGGHMARVLEEYYERVEASDIHDYGAGYPSGQDYLMLPRHEHRRADIITNPPFTLARDFTLKAIADQRDTLGWVCMFARGSLLEGKERYETLFKPHPLAIYAPFVERVPLMKGKIDRNANSATAYAWFCWRGDWQKETIIQHIPPCRSELERDSDYD